MKHSQCSNRRYRSGSGSGEDEIESVVIWSEAIQGEEVEEGDGFMGLVVDGVSLNQLVVEEDTRATMMVEEFSGVDKIRNTK